MTTITITPAIRFHADAQRRSAEAGTLWERGVRKAQYVESFPHSYTEPMLRWAQRVLLAVWESDHSTQDNLILQAEQDGWLA